MRINITRDQFHTLCVNSAEFREDLWRELHTGDLEETVREVCDGVMENKIACVKRVRETFTRDFLGAMGISREDVEDVTGHSVSFDARGIGLLSAKKIVERFLTFS